MDQAFDAVEFVEKLKQGAFDGRVNEVLLKLSKEQLQSVALVMARRLNHHGT